MSLGRPVRICKLENAELPMRCPAEGQPCIKSGFLSASFFLHSEAAAGQSLFWVWGSSSVGVGLLRQPGR